MKNILNKCDNELRVSKVDGFLAVFMIGYVFFSTAIGRYIVFDLALWDKFASYSRCPARQLLAHLPPAEDGHPPHPRHALAFHALLVKGEQLSENGQKTLENSRWSHGICAYRAIRHADTE